MSADHSHPTRRRSSTRTGSAPPLMSYPARQQRRSIRGPPGVGPRGVLHLGLFGQLVEEAILLGDRARATSEKVPPGDISWAPSSWPSQSSSARSLPTCLSSIVHVLASRPCSRAADHYAHAPFVHVPTDSGCDGEGRWTALTPSLIHLTP